MIMETLLKANLILYKLRHKPTGLYFKPSKHMNKCNLSPKGTVYTQRPKKPESIYMPQDVKEDPRNPKLSKTPAEDWETVILEAKEIGTF